MFASVHTPRKFWWERGDARLPSHHLDPHRAPPSRARRSAARWPGGHLRTLGTVLILSAVVALCYVRLESGPRLLRREPFKSSPHSSESRSPSSPTFGLAEGVEIPSDRHKPPTTVHAVLATSAGTRVATPFDSPRQGRPQVSPPARPSIETVATSPAKDDGRLGGGQVNDNDGGSGVGFDQLHSQDMPTLQRHADRPFGADREWAQEHGAVRRWAYVTTLTYTPEDHRALRSSSPSSSPATFPDVGDDEHSLPPRRRQKRSRFVEDVPSPGCLAKLEAARLLTYQIRHAPETRSHRLDLPIVVLVGSEVPASHRETLRRDGAVVVPIEEDEADEKTHVRMFESERDVEIRPTATTDLGGASSAMTTTTSSSSSSYDAFGPARSHHVAHRTQRRALLAKLWAWRLTQYERVLYLDVDTLLVRSLDDVFLTDEEGGKPYHSQASQSAVGQELERHDIYALPLDPETETVPSTPEAGPGPHFSTSFLLLRPSNDAYAHYRRLLAVLHTRASQTSTPMQSLGRPDVAQSVWQDAASSYLARLSLQSPIAPSTPWDLLVLNLAHSSNAAANAEDESDDVRAGSDSTTMRFAAWRPLDATWHVRRPVWRDVASLSSPTSLATSVFVADRSLSSFPPTYAAHSTPASSQGAGLASDRGAGRQDENFARHSATTEHAPSSSSPFSSSWSALAPEGGAASLGVAAWWRDAPMPALAARLGLLRARMHGFHEGVAHLGGQLAA